MPYPPLGVWHCPAADRPSGLRRNEGFADYGYNVYGVGAVTQQTALGLGGHYVWASTQSTSRLPGPPVKESEVASPSEMMAIADGFHGGSGVVRDGAGWLMRDSSTQDNVGSTKRAYARHDGKANVVFCDGHVESPKLPFLLRTSVTRLWSDGTAIINRTVTASEKAMPRAQADTVKHGHEDCLPCPSSANESVPSSAVWSGRMIEPSQQGKAAEAKAAIGKAESRNGTTGIVKPKSHIKHKNIP